ncbi:hypothetical protein OQA88_8994 [Cercophora sp. LCS_1]
MKFLALLLLSSLPLALSQNVTSDTTTSKYVATVTVTVTSTLPVFITTVNPSGGITKWVSTSRVVYAATTTTTSVSGCTARPDPTYFPSPPPVYTYTITAITRPTIYITNAAHPQHTAWATTTSTLSLTNTLTRVSLICTNTLYRHITYTSTYTSTVTAAPTSTTRTTTIICLVSQYSNVPIPGVTPYENFFPVFNTRPSPSFGPNITVQTTTEEYYTGTTITTSVATATSTSTYCNQPEVTVTVTRGVCGKPDVTAPIVTGETLIVERTNGTYTSTGLLDGVLTTLTGVVNGIGWAWTHTVRTVVIPTGTAAVCP